MDKDDASPNLIAGTDIIFVAVHVHSGSDLGWLLVEGEQNVARFVVEAWWSIGPKWWWGVVERMI